MLYPYSLQGEDLLPGPLEDNHCGCILFVLPYPRNVVSFLALPDSCAGSQPDSMLLVPCGDTFCCLLSEGRRLAACALLHQGSPKFGPRTLERRESSCLPALLCPHPAAPGPTGM